MVNELFGLISNGINFDSCCVWSRGVISVHFRWLFSIQADLDFVNVCCNKLVLQRAIISGNNVRLDQDPFHIFMSGVSNTVRVRIRVI